MLWRWVLLNIGRLPVFWRSIACCPSPSRLQLYMRLTVEVCSFLRYHECEDNRLGVVTALNQPQLAEKAVECDDNGGRLNRNETELLTAVSWYSRIVQVLLQCFVVICFLKWCDNSRSVQVINMLSGSPDVQCSMIHPDVLCLNSPVVFHLKPYSQ